MPTSFFWNHVLNVALAGWDRLEAGLGWVGVLAGWAGLGWWVAGAEVGSGLAGLGWAGLGNPETEIGL